jgi:hypothetical protein
MGTDLLLSPVEVNYDPALADAPVPTIPSVRSVPSWGGPLAESDYEALAKSWITRELADQAMLRRVDAQQGREAIGQKGNRDCAGILIPFYDPEARYPHAYRLRRDNPEWKQGKDGTLKPDRKYLGEPGSGNRIYFPPGVTLAQLADPATPIVIVEGEKKALALQRLAYHDIENPRFIPVAIAGVWNWRGTVGKTGGPRGERVDIKGPINDLNLIVWNVRTVFILFDTNVAKNDSVKWARKGISRELATRRAEVRCINLPEDSGLNGVDDLLFAWGPARVLELFEKTTSGTTLQVVRTPQFQSKPEGMFRVTTRGEQLVEIQLANYRASIVTNFCLDDGVETKREFEIECELTGRQFAFTVPAARFAPMDWPIEQMGPHAITFPNQKEYARAAIQSFSKSAEERRVYTHSGWRDVDGRWLFLHAGGAIDAAGAVQGVNVRLPGALSQYELRLPSTPEALVVAVRSSLKLIELAPPSIGYPVLAAICRSVFGGADFALHVVGETGAFKSELAALAQQFFGAGMDRTHLPGSWASTGNSLEILAFHGKDALVVMDDFAPQGNAADVARYHAAADRVFRAAGNLAGRGRLDSNARLREPRPPRGLILSTGEEIPRGHSIRARLFILELSKGAITPAKLSECQAAARAGDYAQAMTGFLAWLAGRFEAARASIDQRVVELRERALRDPAHARTPDIIANLQAAFESYIEFARECGTVDESQAETFTHKCWRALRDAAVAQAKHQAASEPTARFLSLVRACLSSGQAHLAARDGGVPKLSPESCGWRKSHDDWSPQGNCIGWINKADIYIEPTAAYQVVQLAGRDTGEPLAVSEQTLKKRLREKGLLASIDKSREVNTIRRTLAGSRQEVLHFLRGTLLPVDEPDCSD